MLIQICAGPDGISVHYVEEEEVLVDLNQGRLQITDVLEYLPRDSDPNSWGTFHDPTNESVLFIRGEVVYPKPKAKVISYEFE